MSQLVIEIDNADDDALLIKLLPRLNARLVDRQQLAEQKPSFIEVAREVAAQGGAGESFGDPSEWQRKIRSWDRVLEGREE